MESYTYGLAIAAAVFANTAIAHHAQAPFFDQERTVEVEGVVQRFDFRNPHPVLYIEAEGEDGSRVTWEMQFAPATWLAKRGWTSTTFVPGDRVIARGHPSRQPGTYGLQGGTITKADGSEIDAPADRED